MGTENILVAARAGRSEYTKGHERIWGSDRIVLVVRILGFHCRGPGSIPGQGTEIPRGVAK